MTPELSLINARLKSLSLLFAVRGHKNRDIDRSEQRVNESRSKAWLITISAYPWIARASSADIHSPLADMNKNESNLADCGSDADIRGSGSTF